MMDINILAIVVVIILAGLCWYANEQLNNIPVLKSIIRVLIVVLSVLMVMQNMGLLGYVGRTVHIG